MENDSIFFKICQHTCRLVVAVFRSGYLVHVNYLLHARRAGVIVVSFAYILPKAQTRPTLSYTGHMMK
jgi:hypothetical protein